MGTEPTDRVLYRFADFVLDPSAPCLRRRGETVVLSASALLVLTRLVQQRARTVTRKELFLAGWPATAVTEGSLTQAIWELRRAFQDSACGAAVQTVRGVGYRFMLEEVEQQLARPATSAAHDAPFFGRASELARLGRGLSAAQQGAGRTLVVSGPAAIGKTRLCSELIEERSAAGLQLLSATALPQGGSPACWPWLQMLSRQLEGASAAVLRRCLQLAPLAAPRIPSLRAAMQCEPQTCQNEHAYLLEELTRLLVDVTAGRPSILWLDDLHWADEASIALLPMLSRAIRRRPLVLLLSCRSNHGTQLARVLAELSREHPNEHFALSGLSAADVARVLEHRGAPASAAEPVNAVSAGKPLLTLQVAELVARRGSEPLCAERATGRQELLGLLAGQLLELSPEALALLQAASLLRPEFRASELAALRGIDAEQTFSGLEQLERDAYVRELRPSSGSFDFFHPAWREAAYASLPRPARLALHRRAAERIEQSGSDHVAEQLSELAHHYFRAVELGCAQQALCYCLKVADRARCEAAYPDAIVHYERALAAHDLLREPQPELRVRMLLALGEAAAGGALDTQRVRSIFREAAERAAALGAHELCARAALGYVGQHAIGFMPLRIDGTVDKREIELLEHALAHAREIGVELRALLLSALAFALASTTQRTRREALLREAVDLARAQDSPWLLARVLLAKAYASTAADQLPELRSVADELVLLAERLDSPGLGLNARLLRVQCLLQTAELAAARADALVAARYAQQIGCPADKQRAGLLDVLVAFWEGRIFDAQRLSTLAFEAAPNDPHTRLLYALRMGQVWNAQQGYDKRALAKTRAMASTFPTNEGWAAGIAWMAAVVGAQDEAREHFDLAARDRFATLPEDHSWLPIMQLLGESAVRLGDPQRAGLVYARLEPYADRVVFHGWCANPGEAVAATLGRLASVLQRHDEAMSWFRHARALYGKLGASLFEAALDVAEAQALLRSGRAGERTEAVSLIVRAARFAESHKVRWLLQEALAAQSLLGTGAEGAVLQGSRNVEA